jgi:poly-gamma-glutamate system protein
LLATLSAVAALEAQPITILSLGASSYGATRPDFHLGDLYDLLEEEGLVTVPAAAVSLGGGGDVGRGFDPAFREGLTRELRASSGSGPVFLESSALRVNVVERMAVYGNASAFVNIGGAEANLGISPEILEVPPGLLPEHGLSSPSYPGGVAGDLELPPEAQRGVLFEMASRGVPVIHLLHVRGLALRYGLSWDPLPLPEPGSTSLVDAQGGKSAGFWLLSLGYLLSLVVVFGVGGRSAPPERVRQSG